MKTMVYGAIEGVFVCAHSKANPHDEEWEELVQFHQATIPRCLTMLVFTKGGAPTPKQRKVLNDYLCGRPMRVAVITDQKVVSMVVNALNLFNPLVKAFGPDDIFRASTYLEISPDRAGRLVFEASKLRAQVTG